MICCAFCGVAVAAAPAARVPARAPVLRLGSRTLHIGMGGTDVFHLQVLLSERGFKVATDRAFGQATRAAVERAQRRYGLLVDGIVGPATLGALRTGKAPTCPSAPGPGDYVTRWAPVASCVLGLLNQSRSPALVDDVLLVIANESAGNPRAINTWDINARHGDPSRGLMQVIGKVFNAYRSPALANDIFDPAANIAAGITYAIHRYGAITSIPGVVSVATGHHYVPYRMMMPAGHR